MVKRSWTERHIVELIVKHGGSLAKTQSSSVQRMSSSTVKSTSPQQAEAIVAAFRASLKKGEDDGDS